MNEFPAAFLERLQRPGHPGEWESLRLLNSYRLFVALVLLIAFLYGPSGITFGRDAPLVFYSAAAAYLIAALSFALLLRNRRPGAQSQTYLQIYTDVVALAVASYASGGVDSGIAILLIVPVAGAGMLLQTREALLYAALATLMILTAEVVRQMELGPSAASYPEAALFGGILFASAVLASRLARQSAQTRALAQQRQADLRELAELNERIIQQMESGILVIDQAGQIRLANTSAHQLLGSGDELTRRPLREVAPGLAQALERWREAPAEPIQPIAPGHDRTRSVQPEFRDLGRQGTLISIEDAGFIQERLQQLKLASLGRLTASIAHEIRNPLGAISHSAQLLAESEGLAAPDRRLLEIQLEQCRRVNGIVEDILQLSRRRGFSRSKLELVDWTVEFVEEFVHRHDVAAGRLTLGQAPERAHGHFDPDHLRQVLDNLCGNSIKHGRTEAGNAVDVSIDIQLADDGTVLLDVSDNGVPIETERVDEIFEPFFTTSQAGTGLGLFLARELCTVNGAQLRYVPDERGSRFRLAIQGVTDDTDE